MEEWRALVKERSLPDFYDEMMLRTGYAAMLEDRNDVESRARLENVRELKSSLVGYEENHPEDASLSGFLEEIALYTDIEQYDPNADAVVMMTMHAAKGLEFPFVFIVGAEEGLFPSARSLDDGDSLEEERRLCYVAITRAKEKVMITYAAQRMLYGRTTVNRPSRFVMEIPEKLRNGPVRAPRTGYRPEQTYGGYGSYGGERPRPKRELPTYQTAQAPVRLELRAGDSVEHTAFGRGLVISVMKMGNDALLEIAFDQKGTKRLMANAAGRHMKKL